MVPLRAKRMWQWLRLTGLWCLPVRVQDRLNRQNAWNQVVDAMQKTRRILSIAGLVIEMEERYFHLKAEGIFIFLDIKPVFNEENPHLLCAIETEDLAAYSVAHKMMSVVAASLGVQLRIPDEEAFWPGIESSGQRIANALDGKGIFWICCGCPCLEITEDEGYNRDDDWPKDNGCCNFFAVLASDQVFETKCQEGEEIIVAIRRHSKIPFVEPKKSVIF